MTSLAKQVLEANQRHKDALNAYTNELQAEFLAIDKLIAAVEELPEDESQDDPSDKWCLHAEGAFKPISIIDLTTTRDENSPFYEDAVRRDRYLKATMPNPFSNSEKRYLEKAVVKENKRLAAMRAKQRGEDVFEAVAGDNDFFMNNTEGIDWTSVARDVSASNYPLGNRTAQECKVRWLGAQHPKFNSDQWSEPEEERLRELVESKRDSRIDWEEISQLLGTNRTPLDCIKKYQAGSRPIVRWTSALDQKLMEAVQKHGSNNWALVASAVSPEVSANQCQIRYGRSLNPKIKRGKFSADEDELLRQAVEAHGSDWVKVAQAVPGRTNTQCRDRYKHQLMGGVANTGWTDEEDTMLREAVKKHGEDWEKVREEMNRVRQQTQYATRYRTLTRRDARDAVVRATRDDPPASIPQGGRNSELNISATQPKETLDPQGSNLASTRLTITIPKWAGKVAKRGRKNPADLRSDTEDGGPKGDNPSDTRPETQPRPRPRHKGVMAATSAGPSVGYTGFTQTTDAGNDTDSEHHLSQTGLTSTDVAQTSAILSEGSHISQEQLRQSVAASLSADLSDLTDLEDLNEAPPKKRPRSRVETVKSATATRIMKPRSALGGTDLSRSMRTRTPTSKPADG